MSIYDFNVTNSVLRMNEGATVILEDFDFARNVVDEKSTSSGNNALITVGALSPDDNEDRWFPVEKQSTMLLLNEGSFDSNTAPYTLMSETTGAFTEKDAKIYSIEERAVHYTAPDSLLTTTLPPEEMPSVRKEHNATSPWFVAVHEV